MTKKTRNESVPARKPKYEGRGNMKRKSAKKK